MRIGIAIEETWDFFNDIYTDLSEHHQTTLFNRREFDSPFFNERINRRLLKHDFQALMQENDVVFFEWASHLLAYATHLPKTCGIVTRLHRYEMYQWVDQINWDAVDKMILVSEAKKREFIGLFPDQASKIEVIPVGIDINKFQFKPKPFVGAVGTLCHLTPRKRVYELILAFRELSKQRGDFHLHIAGGQKGAHGDYYVALHHLVKDLGLQEKVTFHGNVTDTWNWYQQIDIFVSNSYSEGLQVAPIEAMASGCYCLSHRWDGAEELLPEENLFYSDNELMEKILRYCELPESAKQECQRHMRETVCERFDVDKTKIKIRKVIEDLFESRSRQ